jgi:hypothetical protein
MLWLAVLDGNDRGMAGAHRGAAGGDGGLARDAEEVRLVRLERSD